MADSKDTDKTRRDLYAISTGLIIFNLAGGTFATDAPTIFGTVHIARVWVLALSVWVLWAYFLWRFWLSAKPIFKPWRDDIHSAIQNSERWKTHCADTGEHLRQVRESGQSLGLGLSNEELQELRYYNAVQMAEALRRKEIGFPRRWGNEIVEFADFNLHEKVRAYILQNTRLSAQDLFIIRARAVWVATFSMSAFSDITLPFIFSLIAPVLFILRIKFGVISF